MKMRWRDMIKDRSKENTIWDYIIPIGLTLISILFFVVGMSVLSALGHGTPPEPNVVLFFIFLPISIVISVVYYLLTRYLSRLHRVLLFPVVGGIALAFYILTALSQGLPQPLYGISFIFLKLMKFFAIITAFGIGYTVGSLILYIIYWIGGRIK